MLRKTNNREFYDTKMVDNMRQKAGAFYCKECKCTLETMHQKSHEETCPPVTSNQPEVAFTHGYISNDKVLFNLLTTPQRAHVNADVLEMVACSDKLYAMLLSPQLLQMLDVEIGGSILVKQQHRCRILIGWPCPIPVASGSLTCMLMSQDAMNFHDFNYSDVVAVRKLQNPPLSALQVVVSPESQYKDMHLYLERYSNLPLYQHLDRVVCDGSFLMFRLLGNQIKVKVIEVEPAKSLTERMRSVDLHCATYRIEATTKMIFNSQGSSVHKKMPEITLADIGGLDKAIAELREMMRMVMFDPRSDDFGPRIALPKGVLLFGSSGTGKTLLARTLLNSYKCPHFSVSAAELFSKYVGETESKLNTIFSDAIERSPSTILMDDVDLLCQRRGSGTVQEQRVAAALLYQLDRLQAWPVFVVATSSRPDALDEALRRPGRLDREFELPVPGPEARADILAKMLNTAGQNTINQQEIEEIARVTHGFVGADLLSLVSEAVVCAHKEGGFLAIHHLQDSLRHVRPSAMREVVSEIPAVRWSDIGGQSNLKRQLKQAVEWPLLHPDAFTRLGIRSPRGLLMFGPPGCSKTMIARALATESKLNFLSIKGPELFNKFVGESERAVRDVFRRARQVAPAIIFFDEIDALGGTRSGSSAGGGSSVQDRVLAQLLTELDGVEPLGNVIVVAATNRPDLIDQALLRPGRLDRIVHVPLPDEQTRREILQLQFRKTPIAPDVDVDELVTKTKSYSGAEVTAVCHEAALAALQEDIKCSKVQWRHFLEALRQVTPRTPKKLLQLYKQYQNSQGQMCKFPDPDPDSDAEENATGIP